MSRRAPLNGSLRSRLFALLVTLGPLAFGAVDQLTQIVIAVIFAAGVIACPPQVGRLGVWTNRLVIFGVIVLIAKELAPAAWFGASDWRTTLTNSYGVYFPWTHHPEPGRAVDVWFAGAVAVVWFLWVRTLASSTMIGQCWRGRFLSRRR